ncbi:MAG: glycosyltransferase family 4 protein [Lachnospiraceae bacterium]|nr:glycosyltransferase family 4 protein [Lachnospiraceae bacterium]
MNRKKKLLVTASTFPRWEGDTEPRFVLDLCSHMADKCDVTALVPAASGAKDREILEGVEVIRYHYFPIHKWETLCYPGAIVSRIKEKKIRVLLVPFLLLSLYLHLFKLLPQFDMVHAHWLIPQGIVQSFFKTPYIVTGHGGDVTSMNQGILRKLKIRCLKRADHVTVVSEHLKNIIQQMVPEIHPDIISMGVDAGKFGGQYYVSNYFGQGNRKVVLFVGRLVEIKGVEYLIEAMKSVDALLVIVGDGPLKDKLQLKADGLGKNEVKFLGGKTHEELKNIFASADVFVIPSITAADGAKEGFGLVILEAMASGLPVIASNSGGIPQLIQNGINGLLCEEKDIEALSISINKLLNDKQLSQQLVDNGKRTIKQYDYSLIAKKYDEILRNK